MAIFVVECVNVAKPNGEHDFKIEIDECTLVDLRARAPAFLGGIVCPICSTAQKIITPAIVLRSGETVDRENVLPFESTPHDK